MWNQKRRREAKGILKKNTIAGVPQAKFQVVLQPFGHQDSVARAQKQTKTDQCNRIQNPEMSPQLYGQLIFDKAGKNIHCKKGQSLHKMLLGKLDVQKKETRPFSYTIYMDTLKMDETDKM